MRPNSRFATLLLCVLGAAQQLCPLAVVGARIEQERSQSTMSSTIERHAGSSIQKIEPRKQQKEEGAGSDGASGRAGEAVGAAAESEPDADEQEKPQKKKKTRRYVAADGTVFAFNSTTRNWELETGTVAGGGSAPMLLIKDRAFSYDFARGEFSVAGHPLVITSFGDGRDAAQQQHADTGRIVWDGAVLLAKTLELVFPHFVRGARVLELGSGGHERVVG
eukprot:INCI12865.1.p1 GENE.INCI12865.1~~INCI12865.1.p1  ORF type:complete len:221 (-),score=41.46 INCI12865.1:134-796(-)